MIYQENSQPPKKKIPSIIKNYINKATSRDKQDRIKLCKEILHNDENIFYEGQNILSIKSHLIYWLVKLDTNEYDTTKKIMMSIDIIDDYEQKQAYIKDILQIFFRKAIVLLAVLEKYPDAQSIIKDIENERNSLYYKFKHSEFMAPAFNGSGCIIL